MDYIDREQYHRLKEISELQPHNAVIKLKDFLTFVKPRSTRTSRQNNSLHLYLHQVAQVMQERGITMQDVLERIRKIEIMPTGNALKEVAWKPLLEILKGKKSTTEHDKLDIDEVYEVMNKWLGQEWNIHIPFPTSEETITEVLGQMR